MALGRSGRGDDDNTMTNEKDSSMTRKTTPKAPPAGGFTITAAPAAAPLVTYFDAFRMRDALAELLDGRAPSTRGLELAEFLLETGIANTAVIEALAAGNVADDDDADDVAPVVDGPGEDTDPETCREVSCRATSLEHDHGPDCTPGCMVCTPIGAKR